MKGTRIATTIWKMINWEKSIYPISTVLRLCVIGRRIDTWINEQNRELRNGPTQKRPIDFWQRCNPMEENQLFQQMVLEQVDINRQPERYNFGKPKAIYFGFVKAKQKIWST